MDINLENRIAIECGSTSIGFTCEDRNFMEKLCIGYRPFLVSGKPDFNIHLALKDTLKAEEIKHLLGICQTFRDDNRYYTKPELIDCRVDWDKATLLINTEKKLFNPEVDYRFMNLILRGIYSGIFRELRKTSLDNYLIHGCGINNSGHCYLFAGASGAGKSTIARLAEGREILNDEAVLIGRNSSGFHISGTPFDGGQPEKSNATYHLSAIFFLKHDTQVTVKPLSSVEAYKRMLTQVFDTSSLFDLQNMESFAEQTELCEEIAVKVPSYELGFLRDSSFWQHLKNV